MRGSEMMQVTEAVDAGPITPEVRAAIEQAAHFFAAIVTPDGQPDLSPVGRVRAWDDWHVYFTDTAGSRTREYAESNPWVSLNVVDQAGRGFRILGDVTIHEQGEIHDAAASEAQRAQGPVMLLRVERLEALDPQAEASSGQLQP